MPPSRLLTASLLVVIALSVLTGLAAGQESQPFAPDAPAGPLSSAFTYQGSLRSGGAPANGAFDFRFALYDAEIGGSQVGPTFVAGGFGNTAGGASWTGDYAAVPGGYGNTAGGEFSFAAGRRAKANAQAAEGAIASGDHLFIVVYGMAQVRADASAGPIAAGQRLTSASRAGHARALRTVAIEGVPVAEATPSIGVALEPLTAGQGLIWVLVTVQ
jgi:hypothetical protein